MKKFLGLLIVAILLSSLDVYAQKWMSKLEGVTTTSASFFDIQNAFYDSHKDVPISSYQREYKKFKRWETYMEARVNDDGFFPTHILWKESKRIMALRSQGLKNNSNWYALGPSYTPLWSVNNIWNGTRSGTGRVECIEFHPTNDQIIWVGTHSGGLWKTIDGGENWFTTTDELPSIGISDIVLHPSNPDTMYIGTGDRDTDWTFSIGLLKSTDGGISFEETGLNYAIQENEVITKILIRHDIPETLIVSTTEGIYKSNNAGDDWTLITSGNFRDMAFKPGDQEIIYATTYSFSGGARMYMSVDGGDSFYSVDTGIPPAAVSRISIGVTAANPEIVYLVSCKTTGTQSGLYGIYKSEDSGASWMEMASGNTINLLGRSLNGNDTEGYGWYTLSIEVSQDNPDQLYVGGINMWRSDDGGLSWEIKTTESANIPGVTRMWVDHHEIRINPYTATLYTCHDGGVYKSDDAGDSFADITDGLNINQMYRIGCSASDEDVVVAGCQDQFGMLYRDGEWLALFTGEASEHFIDYTDPEVLYCYGFNFGMIRSDNGGYSYTNINPPGIGNFHWLAPTIMHPTDNNTIFLGIHGIYKSTNRGEDWETLIPSLISSAELESLAVAPSNDNYMYAASPYYIWRSSNGGYDWENINSGIPEYNKITDIAVSNTDPEHIWISLSRFAENMKVFESMDGGETWINISGNLPNVPVHTIVHDGRGLDGVYVGTDIGIFYINNTMDEWIDYSNGLPNVVVNEIEIHYGSDKLRAGTYGRGLWESELYDITIGIDENIEEVDFIVMPNPAQNNISVRLNIRSDGNTEIRLRDIYGRELVNFRQVMEASSSQYKFNVSSLSSGIYLLELWINDHIHSSKKIIKI